MTTLAEKSTKRRYRFAAKPNFPCNVFAVKCERFDLPPYFIKDKDENGKEIKVERKRYRTIDIPISRRFYRDHEDDTGRVVVGAVHELDDKELAFVKKEIDRFIVRWARKYKPPKNNPTKDGGVGPGHRYASGSVIAISTSEGERDYRYEPPSPAEIQSGLKLDEPASNYITIVPEETVRAVDDGTITVSDDAQEVARLRRELEEARRQLEAAEARREEEDEAQARADEREDLKTVDGQVAQAMQASKKRRGRPPKQR